ncbi:MAG: YaiI/YqxD family protein [Xanthomonadales bacterium]|nr:YaiI/YqxD family protein [Xanthomonadales bacterium]
MSEVGVPDPGQGCVWVDADGCPQAVKEILIRAAERTGVNMVMVANRLIKTPPHLHNIRCTVVPPGFDAADKRIAELAQPGDLVIASDIPLAAEVIEKGAQVIGFRGEEHDLASIRQRLVMRDLMETLRASGIQSSGPAAYGQQDKQRFGNALDRALSLMRRKGSGKRAQGPA